MGITLINENNQGTSGNGIDLQSPQRKVADSSTALGWTTTACTQPEDEAQLSTYVPGGNSGSLAPAEQGSWIM